MENNSHTFIITDKETGAHTSTIHNSAKDALIDLLETIIKDYHAGDLGKYDYTIPGVFDKTR